MYCKSYLSRKFLILGQSYCFIWEKILIAWIEKLIIIAWQLWKFIVYYYIIIFDLSFPWNIDILILYSPRCKDIENFEDFFVSFRLFFHEKSHELERSVFFESNISGTKSWREKIDEKP